MRQVFIKLNLKQGDLIFLINEKGEGFTGSYENDYDSSYETFKFNNYSNGKIITIYIDLLQDLRRI
jgi:hypothetical protein